MQRKKTQRIRDPIHDVISFEQDEPLDQLAWDLLNTHEVQRLRRIKQIGGAEFVYPSATHTRFSHSIGVFHNARKLLRVLKREFQLHRARGKFDVDRSETALLAALLHDVGHGPLSHPFEEATREISLSRPKFEFVSHEHWSARLITDATGELFPLLESYRKGLAGEIAAIIRAPAPSDMYHAIVTSSFDADRLDYIQRDRYMTGTGIGAIDFGWLVDNFRVAPPSQPRRGTDVHSFCLLYKAREAAEDFLLARLRLYTNVYFHKTSRGFEQMFRAIFQAISEAAASREPADIGLEANSSVLRFFLGGGQTLANYKRLDDGEIWSALPRLKGSADPRLSELPKRIIQRRRLDALDLQIEFPEDKEGQANADEALKAEFGSEIGFSVFRDEKRLHLYGTGDEDRSQRRVMIQLRNGASREITEFPDSMIKGGASRNFIRYYFVRPEHHARAKDLIGVTSTRAKRRIRRVQAGSKGIQ